MTLICGTAANLAQHSRRTENCFSYTTRFLVYFELLKWMNRRQASGSNLNAFSALSRSTAIAPLGSESADRVHLTIHGAPVYRCWLGRVIARQSLPKVADQLRAATALAGAHRATTPQAGIPRSQCWAVGSGGRTASVLTRSRRGFPPPYSIPSRVAGGGSPLSAGHHRRASVWTQHTLRSLSPGRFLPY